LVSQIFSCSEQVDEVLNSHVGFVVRQAATFRRNTTEILATLDLARWHLRRDNREQHEGKKILDGV
jgi:hypothetical protein